MTLTPLKLAGLLLVLGGVGFLWIAPFESARTDTQGLSGPAALGASSAESVSAMPQTAAAIPEHLLMVQSVKTIHARIRSRRVNQQLLFPNDQAFEQARLKESLFTSGVTPEVAAQSPLANPQRLKDGRLWFSYDLNVLGARAEGDKFSLQIPGSGTVQAEIERVDVVQGQYRWSGRIINQPDSRFFITQVFSEQYAVGTINTPFGEFQLESKSGTGWISPASGEFRLPPDGNDTMAPDHHKH